MDSGIFLSLFLLKSNSTKDDRPFNKFSFTSLIEFPDKSNNFKLLNL